MLKEISFILLVIKHLLKDSSVVGIMLDTKCKDEKNSALDLKKCIALLGRLGGLVG